VRLIFSSKGTGMQYAHIFGYSSNISATHSVIKSNRFLTIILSFGTLFFGYSTINCNMFLTRPMVENYLKSLDEVIETLEDGELKDNYIQDRQYLYESLQRGVYDTQDTTLAEHTKPMTFKPVILDKSRSEIFNAILPATVADVDTFIETFKRKLPSVQLTKKVMKEAKRQHPKLRQVIKQLRDDERYERVKYPTRLLFVGPSGCGKTTTAEALARYCDQTCIFINASSIATTYQNSGAQFFDIFFRCLKENDSEEFLVIIDEISLITQMSSNEKDGQQNKMATAFWLGLDEIRNKRHICVIGTTNSDPKTLPEQLKTRFANNIYYFEHPTVDTITALIKDNLNTIPKSKAHKSHTYPEKLYNCSNTYIQQLAESVSHLSLREIEDLVEKAKALAITESNDPYALVTVAHLEQVFAEHTQSWYSQAWRHKTKYLKPLVSARAFTFYAAISGLLMHFYSDNYKEHGLFLTTIASLINNYLPRPHGEPNDTHVFSNITHWFANYKYRQFYSN
jgi:SpoVK/Ycf46/Vps4 family AAA+-type ATPase